MQTIYTPYAFTVSDIGSPPTSPSTGDIWVATQSTTFGGRILRQYDGTSWKPLTSTTLLWDSTKAGVSFPTATITTPTLPTIFDTLRVDFRVRGNGGVNTLTNLGLRIDGVSTGSYYTQLMQSHATTAAASESIAATSALIGLMPQGSGGDWGTGTLWIPGYQASNPSFHSISGGGYGTGTNSLWNGVYGGFYIGSGVSTLTFLDSGGNSFISGSRISVYGVVAS